MSYRANRRRDVGPTSVDRSTADREIQRSGPTTPKSIDPRVLRSTRPTQVAERRGLAARGAGTSGGKRQQGCVASVSGVNFAMGTSATRLVHLPVRLL
jgi:hypothetical protein